MAVLLGKMKEYYDYAFYDLCDERTKDMFPSATFLFAVVIIYVYFCLSLGPRLMKNLKPFKLKTPIMYYNIFQIFISFYIFCLCLAGGWLNGYSWLCQPVETEDTPTARYMLRAVWWYTIVKIIDMLDTVFFVLRKKDRQITFLHLFHHGGMPLASGFALKFYPGGHATLLGLINCFVHVIMYSYYLISGLGPKYQKYLWWKKHLTTMQLVQFGILFIQNSSAYVIGGGCTDYPRWICFALSCFSIQFLYLFGSFYYQAYVKTPKQSNNSVHLNGKSKVN